MSHGHACGEIGVRAATLKEEGETAADKRARIHGGGPMRKKIIIEKGGVTPLKKRVDSVFCCDEGDGGLPYLIWNF
jgi:hypothetical protein